MAHIRTKNLIKEYPGGVRGVDDLTLDVRDGEFFALLGPSGCGKTTLLRTLAGLERSTGGSIHIGERDVTALEPGKRNLAMVFQDYALFPHMSVADNVAYPLKIQKVAKPQRLERAAAVAGSLSLGHLLERRPGQLSGGQQQRVALARAVASQPEVFLFDEPLSNLDARLRLEARTFLKRLQLDLGVTTVFVTHDQAEALALADRIAIMQAGKIQQIGTPREVFQHPVNMFVASFIGSVPMNLIPATIRDARVAIGSAALPLPAGVSETAVAPGDAVTFGVRPEYLTVHATPVPDALIGEVTVTENLGASLLLSVDVDGVTVKAIVDEDAEPPAGTRVWLSATPRRTLLFDANEARIGGVSVADQPIQADPADTAPDAAADAAVPAAGVIA